MQKLTFATTDEWMVARRTRATGSRVGDLIPGPRTKGKTKEFYKMMAERYAEPVPDGIDPRDWGHQQEGQALLRFMAETGKVIDFTKTLWVSDEHPLLAYSPDGPILGKDTEVVEVKSLYPDNHLKVIMEKKVPDIYWKQILWAFVVNSKLKTLHFVAYCPLFYEEKLQMAVLEIKRKDVKDEVEALKMAVLKEIADMDSIVKDLATSL